MKELARRKFEKYKKTYNPTFHPDDQNKKKLKKDGEIKKENLRKGLWGKRHEYHESSLGTNRGDWQSR